MKEEIDPLLLALVEALGPFIWAQKDNPSWLQKIQDALDEKEY